MEAAPQAMAPLYPVHKAGPEDCDREGPAEVGGGAWNPSSDKLNWGDIFDSTEMCF